MTVRREAFAFLLIATAASGCATLPPPAPFVVTVRGSASSCWVEVAGRRVTSNELLEIARREATAKRRARLDGTSEDNPYRCIGGAIYTLQMAGFADVGFVAQPPGK